MTSNQTEIKIFELPEKTIISSSGIQHQYNEKIEELARENWNANHKGWVNSVIPHLNEMSMVESELSIKIGFISHN